MRRYWREHSRLWKDLDRSQDEEGLTNVCFNGAPLWLNRFAAAFQRTAFHGLMETLGDLRERKVLDVGCGVGRWSRLMAEAGARVTGIDLQPETLRDNRKRFPRCRFVEMSGDRLGFQDGSFHLATSVTVIQHMPVEIQNACLLEVRRVLSDDGHLVMLEGTKDHGPHVFCHTPEEWRAMAEGAGFKLVKTLPYDFAPLVYGLKNLAFAVRRGSRSSNGDLEPVEEYVSRFRKGAEAGGIGRTLFRAVLRGATIASYPVESLMMRVGSPAWSHHAGLLFKAV